MNRIFLYLIFIVFSSFAIIIRHDVNIKKYIVDPGEFPWLARLQPVGMHGSLIHPKWVVTAVHIPCINSAASIILGGVLRKVRNVYWYSENAIEQNYDIGLIELVESVNDVEPIPIYSGLDALHKTAWLIGAGATGNGITVDNNENYSRKKCF